jgi:hypothetical protein
LRSPYCDLLGCFVFQIFCQGIELHFPESAVLLDPGDGVFHRLRREAATVRAAVNFAAKQAGGFENAQVF